MWNEICREMNKLEKSNDQNELENSYADWSIFEIGLQKQD